MSLDLTFTAEEDAFRADARAWLEANVPQEPLASFDTRDGFAQHRAWERRLHEAGWAVVARITSSTSTQTTPGRSDR